MAPQSMTIGGLKGLLDFAKSSVIGFQFTNVDQFFDKIEELMRSVDQLTPEMKSNLDLGRQELKNNPGLLDIGKAEFTNYVDELLAKYPADTPISDIPELSGDGADGGSGDGGGGTPEPGPEPEPFDIVDFQRIAKVYSDVTVTVDPATGVVNVNGAGYAFTMPDGVERLQFDDGILAFDFLGSPGQLLRLYQAALGRDPDAEGLGFWVRNQDEDVFDVSTLADMFMDTAEYTALYGTPDTVNDAEFVTRLYTNALERDFDQAGFDFWLDQLASGQASRQDLLLKFSQSAESQTQTATEMADGIWYV